MDAKNMNAEKDSFFREYTSPDVIVKYTRATAGYGIRYLLDHDYKEVYLEGLKQLPADVKESGIRMLEFGCGGGMNLLHLISVLQREGIKVEKAIGTDFSPVLIESAKRESERYLTTEQQGKVEFYVGRNETLIKDIAVATGQAKTALEGSFHFILGVNTFRFCHRTGRELDCAQDILRLLVPGGICVSIDMNNRFPAFRSSLGNYFRKYNEEECYLPTLLEYTTPFSKVGFEVLRSKSFCWVPHSAGPLLCGILRIMTPALNTVAGSRAMRSLVVSKKPTKA